MIRARIYARIAVELIRLTAFLRNRVRRLEGRPPVDHMRFTWEHTEKETHVT